MRAAAGAMAGPPSPALPAAWGPRALAVAALVSLAIHAAVLLGHWPFGGTAGAAAPPAPVVLRTRLVTVTLPPRDAAAPEVSAPARTAAADAAIPTQPAPPVPAPDAAPPPPIERSTAPAVPTASAAPATVAARPPAAPSIEATPTPAAAEAPTRLAAIGPAPSALPAPAAAAPAPVPATPAPTPTLASPTPTPTPTVTAATTMAAPPAAPAAPAPMPALRPALPYGFAAPRPASSGEQVRRLLPDPPGPPYLSSLGLDPPPRPIGDVEPVVPPAAGSRGGLVVLRLLISDAGHVDRAEVVSSFPPGLFDASALDAFAKARYTPGYLGGVPVRSQVTFEVRYRGVATGDQNAGRTY